MTHTQKRKIKVNGIHYEWCIRGDYLKSSGTYITIYKSGGAGRAIHLNPYSWDLEIRPKTIRSAILFALESGWVPESKGPPLKIDFNLGTFSIDTKDA